MKFNIYPQEFPALSRYLLRFADGGRFRTSLSAVQSAAQGGRRWRAHRNPTKAIFADKHKNT